MVASAGFLILSRFVVDKLTLLWERALSSFSFITVDLGLRFLQWVLILCSRCSRRLSLPLGFARGQSHACSYVRLMCPHQSRTCPHLLFFLGHQYPSLFLQGNWFTSVENDIWKPRSGQGCAQCCRGVIASRPCQWIGFWNRYRNRCVVYGCIRMDLRPSIRVPALHPSTCPPIKTHGF